MTAHNIQTLANELEACLRDNPHDPYLNRCLRDCFFQIGNELNKGLINSSLFWKKTLSFPFTIDETSYLVRTAFLAAFASAMNDDLPEAVRCLSQAWDQFSAGPPLPEKPLGQALTTLKKMGVTDAGWDKVIRFLDHFRQTLSARLPQDEFEINFLQTLVDGSIRGEQWWCPLDVQIRLDLGIRLIGTGRPDQGFGQLQTALYMQEKVNFGAYRHLVDMIINALDTLSPPGIRLRDRLVWIHYSEKVLTLSRQ